jgi:hypothetical protein
MMDGRIPQAPNTPSYIREKTSELEKPISQAPLTTNEITYNLFQQRVVQQEVMIGIPLAEQYSERIAENTPTLPILRQHINQPPNPPSLLQLSSYPNQEYSNAFTFQEMKDRDEAGFTAYNLHARVDQDYIDRGEMVIGNFHSYNQAFVSLDLARYENHSHKFTFVDEVP